MLNKVLNVAKNPVTKLMEKAKTENVRKEVIKAVVISVAIAIFDLISTVVSIILRFTRKDFWYKNYTSSMLWEKRFEALGKAELFSSFFKSFIIALVAILILAGILFLIAKLVKARKTYASMLSLINNMMIVNVIGMILNFILSFIYEPLGLLVMFAIGLYAVFTLIFAFRNSLEIENENKLVLVTTAVLTVAVAILVVVLCIIYGVPISDVGGFLDLL